MKKLMNGVDTILTDSLSGFGQAHADLVTVSYDPKMVIRKGGAIEC